MIMGPLSTYIGSYSLRMLLYAPIGWPKLILEWIFPIGSFPFTNDTYLLIYIVSCNILFYGLVTFCFLTIRWRRRAVVTEPPPPALGTTH